MIWFVLTKILSAAMACQPVVQDLRQETARNLVGRAMTCGIVALEAKRWGVPTDLALAVAWNESRFDYYAVGAAGEVGPLQAQPRYWCRATPCKPVVAGMRALAYHLDRQSTHKAALARYNGCKSSCGRSKYGQKVLKTAERWSR